MAKTLTLKNLPESLHARLAAAVKRHRRSLNNEAIVCLEADLGSAIPSAEEELTRLRALRRSLGHQVFDPDSIDAFQREGRGDFCGHQRVGHLPRSGPLGLIVGGGIGCPCQTQEALQETIAHSRQRLDVFKGSEQCWLRRPYELLRLG